MLGLASNNAFIVKMWLGGALVVVGTLKISLDRYIFYFITMEFSRVLLCHVAMGSE